MDGNRRIEIRSMMREVGIIGIGRCISILFLISYLMLPVLSFGQDQPQQAVSAPAAVQTPSPSGLSGLNLQDFDKKGQDKIEWSNNPFVQPANEVPVADLKLTGIAYNQQMAAAIINTAIVKKGDKIGSHEVVEINPTNVVLRNENGIFSLSFKGGN